MSHSGRFGGTWISAGLFAFALSSSAAAEDSAYCKKVRARADADAALLFAPSIQAQGIKFPNNGTTDSGVTTGLGYQFRAQVAWSPLNVYRGTRVVKVGEADCKAHDAQTRAQEMIAQGTSYGRLTALQGEARFLASQRSRWEQIVDAAEARLAAQVTPLADVLEVRARATDMARKASQVQAEIAQLEAAGAGSAKASLAAIVRQVETSAMSHEREVSHLRSLDAWEVSAVGGIIPQDKPVDYYGIVAVSFNFGAFWRNAAETRYLDARAEELRTARYELADQIRRFRAQMKGTADAARGELATVDKMASSMRTARAALEGSTAPNAPQAIATLDLDLLSLEADRTYLTTLIAELGKLEENVDEH